MKGGALGGTIALVAGTAAVYGAGRRYAVIQSLTLPFKAFLAVSAGSFGAIVTADRSGRAFESSQHQDQEYHDARQSFFNARIAERTASEKAILWARQNKYSIVFGSWAASMCAAFMLVKRSPLSTAQKLVQARLWAQGLTLTVVIASLGLESAESEMDKAAKTITEAERSKEKDQWMDMVDAEENRMREHGRDLRKA